MRTFWIILIVYLFTVVSTYIITANYYAKVIEIALKIDNHFTTDYNPTTFLITSLLPLINIAVTISLLSSNTEEEMTETAKMLVEVNKTKGDK